MLSYAYSEWDKSTFRSSLYLPLTAEEYTFSLFATENGCPQSSLSPLTYAHFLRGILYKGNALSLSSPSYIIPLNSLFVKLFLLCGLFRSLLAQPRFRDLPQLTATIRACSASHCNNSILAKEKNRCCKGEGGGKG